MSEKMNTLVMKFLQILGFFVIATWLLDVIWQTPLTKCVLFCMRHTHSVEFYVISIALICGFWYKFYLVAKHHTKKTLIFSDLKWLHVGVLIGSMLLFLWIATNGVDNKVFVFQIDYPAPFWEYKSLLIHLIVYMTFTMICDASYKLITKGKVR